MSDAPASTIDTIDALERLYGTPSRPALVKVSRTITEEYAQYIDASPFCALASVGPEGLDCSPRGDEGRVVDIVDPQTVALPDRRGNNRIDTLRNIVRDPRVALMLLIPGSGTVMRINGTAVITADRAWLARYEKDGSAPRSVIVVRVREVYFQCARAVMRSGLWSGETAHLDALPSIGAMLQALSERRSDEAAIDGEAYDREWPERARQSLW